MVEFGPYIEFRCEPYVQLAYVKRCVLIGLLIVAAVHLAVWFIRKTIRRQEHRSGS